MQSKYPWQAMKRKSIELHFRLSADYAMRLRQCGGGRKSESLLARELLCTLLDRSAPDVHDNEIKQILAHCNKIESYQQELLTLIQSIQASLFLRLGDLERKVARAQLRLLAYHAVTAFQSLIDFSVEDAANEIADAYGLTVKDLKSVHREETDDALV